MERIGVRELRQHASRWLERVRQGESFEVTDRGHPVALLVPVPAEGDIIARLTAEGRLTVPEGDLIEFLKEPRPAPEPGRPSASQALAEMREHER